LFWFEFLYIPLGSLWSVVGSDLTLMIKEIPGGITFSVKVHPRAKKNAITGMVGDALKLSLTSPPVDGRANKAGIEFFAKFFRVPRSSVTIAAGEKSRTKVIRVVGLTADLATLRLSGRL
jgi:uncharacterized protein